MKDTTLVLLCAMTLAACSGAGTPPPESAHESSDARALPGNAAVQTRLGPLPAPPIAWSTPVASISTDQFGSLCPYLVTNVHLEASTVTCPDGSAGEVAAYECNPDHMAASARSLPCTISLGEIVACRLAMVEHPCDGGPLGENLDECQAFDACTCTGSRTATATP